MADKDYHWQSPSPLRDMTLSQSKSGKHYAILFAPENEPCDEKLQTAQADLLREAGLLSYPKVVNDKPTLVVYGFNNEQELIQTFENLGIVSGNYDVTIEEGSLIDADPTEPTLKERFDFFRHNYAMNAAGALGFMGHIAMMYSGVIEQEPKKMQIAGIFMLNSALYTLFGNGAEGTNIDAALAQMQENLHKYGVTLPQGEIEKLHHEILENKGMFEKIKHMVGKNVIAINELMGAYNNVLMMQTDDIGLKSAGLLSFIGSMTAVFVPETPVERQDPHLQDNLFGKVASKVMEAPMTVLGLANTIGSVLLFKDTYDRWQNVKDEGYKQNHQAEYDGFKADRVSKIEALQQATGNLANNSTENIDYKKTLKAYDKAHKAAFKAENEFNKVQTNYKIHDLGDKAWLSSLAMCVLYTGANICSMLASKNAAEAEDPAKAYEELFARAAQTALQIPAGARRDKTIALMGMAFASQKDIDNISANTASEIISTMTEQMERNPFVRIDCPEKAFNNITRFERKSPIKPETQIETIAAQHEARLQPDLNNRLMLI